MNIALRSSLFLAVALPIGCDKGAAYFSENHAGKYKTKLESGLAAFDAGQLPEAQADLTAAVDAAEKMGDDAKQAIALQNLASLALRQGKNAEAKAHAAKAAELLAKGPSDDAFLTAAVNLQLGKAALHQADFKTAGESLDKSIAGFEKASEAKGELFDALLTKAMLLQTTGKHADAQVAYRKAIDFERGRRKIGEETYELAAAYCEMGRASIDAGDLQTANQHFDRATKILRALRMLNKEEAAATKPIESWVAANVAWLLHETRQPIRLDGVFTEAIRSFDNLGRPGRESAFLHREFGKLLLEDKKFPQSEVELKRSLELCHAFYGANHPELAKTLTIYANLLDATARADEATDCRNKAKAITAANEKAPDTTKQQANAK
jgi:tetratricopeptide (TPR) repeat protein